MIYAWSLCGYMGWQPALSHAERVGTCEGSQSTHHLPDVRLPSLALRGPHPCPAQEGPLGPGGRAQPPLCGMQLAFYSRRRGRRGGMQKDAAALSG